MDLSGEVFVSYARADLGVRDRMRDWILAEGWLPIADAEIPHGADWDKWIRAAIEKARSVVFVWTKSSINSDPVRHEYMLARQQSKDVSVIADTTSPLDLPMGAASRQVIALGANDWGADALLALRSELLARCGEPSIASRISGIRSDTESALMALTGAAASLQPSFLESTIAENGALGLITGGALTKRIHENLRSLQTEISHCEGRIRLCMERLQTLEQIVRRSGE